MKTTPRTKRRDQPVTPTPNAKASVGDVLELVPRVLGIRRILVPLDFSAPAEKALRYAVSFARQFDAKITLLHVRPIPYSTAEMGGFPTVIPADEPPTEKVQARLDADACRLVPPEIRDRTLLRTGPAYDEICNAARELEADLIIIATHGRTGLKHILLGSTAERVVRHASCPVLVVREHEHEFA
jgi:nucleotide-binding universal stress UspA family protein